MLNRLLFGTLATSICFSSMSCPTHAQATAAKSYPVINGVGLAIRDFQGNIIVDHLVANSPAADSGLITAGARVISIEVDGKTTSLEGKTALQAGSLIRGPVGTAILLNVIPPRATESIKVTLEREPLEVASISAATYRPNLGKPVPKLRLSSLDGAESNSLADYRGQIVVLDFWASWCPNCFPAVTKMQTIASNNPQWKGAVELVAATVDVDHSSALAAIEKNKWHHTKHFGVDLAELSEIGIRAVPVVVIIAPDGTVAKMAAPHEIAIENEVARLLSK